MAYTYTIKDQKYGDTETFKSLAEAEAAIHACGMTDVRLEERGLRIYDNDGEWVGDIEPDRVSQAAATLGAKGGAAGRGASKRRDVDYSALGRMGGRPRKSCEACGSHPAYRKGICVACEHAIQVHGATRADAHTVECDRRKCALVVTRPMHFPS